MTVVRKYWWVAIEGLRKRYGTYQPSWNPADSGMNRYIDDLLARPPQIGGQTAHPLDGKTDIPQHAFELLDRDGDITFLLAVSNTPKNKTFLTASIEYGTLTRIRVNDNTDFQTSGHLYIGRETFYYTSKATETQTGYTADELTGQTADSDPLGSSKVRVYDYARSEDGGFWDGGWITFTSGSNNGQTRQIKRSVGTSGLIYPWSRDFEDEQARTLYLDPDDPLPNNVTAGDTYTLRYANHRLRDSALSGTDWIGARVTVTADTNSPKNVGEVRWVKDFVDSNLLEFYEPLPQATSTTTTYTIVRKSFEGVSRSLYGSEEYEHSVLDMHGTPIPIDVVDQPPYMKTRRAWIYENEIGAVENSAKCTKGQIDDFTMDSSGSVYLFECSGLLKILSRKMLTKQKRAKIAEKPLWGGSFYQFIYAYDGRRYLWPVMAEGTDKELSVTEIIADSSDDWPFSANIKIDDEILYYRRKKPKVNLVDGTRFWFELADHVDYKWQGVRVSQTLRAKNLSTSQDRLALNARSVFAEQIGLEPVQKQFVSKMTHPHLVPTVVPAMMQEHEIGSDIVNVIICSDQLGHYYMVEGSDIKLSESICDFNRFDELHISSPFGSISPGDTIKGDESYALAMVAEYDDTNGILYIIKTHYKFENEGITRDGGGFTATVDEFRIGDGEDLPAVNNPLLVFLQLLLSKKGDHSNGKYDCLSDGFGAGIDENDVDIAGIENLMNTVFPSATINFVIHEPTSLKKWAERNIFKLLHLFPYETTDGKLSLAYLYTEAEAIALDTGSMVEINSSNIDSRVLPRWKSGMPPVSKMKVRYNKHPVRDEYYSEMEVNFNRSKTYYQNFGRTVVLDIDTMYVPKSMSQKIAPANPELPSIVSRLINPMWGRYSSYPAPIIDVDCSYSLYDSVEIGQAVKFTHPSLPNLKTGYRGMTDEYFQVIGKTSKIDEGKLALTLLHIGIHDQQYGRCAPSGLIYSYTGDTPVVGKSTIRLYDRIYSPSGEKDCDKFTVGDVVMIMRDDYDELITAPTTFTVDSINSSTNEVVLDSNSNPVPIQGYILETVEYSNATSSQKSKYVYLADENLTLGASNDNAFKYK